MTATPEHFSFKNLLPEQKWIAYLLIGFALYAVWDQYHWWSTREDYSFGYLVPLFAAYVLYERWPVMKSYFVRGVAPGERPLPAERANQASSLMPILEGIAVAGFAGSLVLFAIGALLRAATGPQNPASLAIAASLGGFVLCGVFIFSKYRQNGEPIQLKQRIALTGLFLFPALIWLLSAPLVSVAETKLRVFLLMKVTGVVFNVFDVLGYELERQGNVLLLPEGQVGVEEACSGILSLMACLFAGSFLAAVFLDRFWKKVLLVAAAMFFAVLTNMMRSLFLTYWAYHYGSDAIDDHWVLPLIGDIGSVHDVAGLAIMGFTCTGLILLLPVFNYKLKDFDDEDGFEIDDSDEDESTAPQG